MSKSHKKTVTLLVLVAIFLFSIVIMPKIIHAANEPGPNYRNVTVRTTVNISNSFPEVVSVIVYQETNISLRNVTLNAGSTRTVNCNATIRDWNGYGDIILVNATLWDSINSTFASADNNNSHYTNTNCTNSGNGVNYTVNYICSFNVYYYANNGTWNCNVTAMDTLIKSGNRTNSTTILPIYALNVTDGINYGSVAVESDSLTQTANVTNFGNMPINISVEGYGTRRGDGLAMNCSLSGNISVDNERFSLSDTGNWIDKTALSSTQQSVANLTIQKQTVAATSMVNTTYWQLHIPPNPSGNCTGYIVFQAQTS